jgi:hypothetical protein
MATYTDNCIESKFNEDAVGVTARERDRSLPHQSLETMSGLEATENTGMNFAQFNPRGDKGNSKKIICYRVRRYQEFIGIHNKKRS